MEGKKKMLYLLLQIMTFLLLMILLSNQGISTLAGGAVAVIFRAVVSFGAIVLALSGVVTGFLLKTRRQRIYRDTQIHLFKYMATLGALQILAMFMTGAFGFIPDELINKLSPYVSNVVTITFSVMAFIMPINYMKSQFTSIKQAEYRDPRKVVESFF